MKKLKTVAGISAAVGLLALTNATAFAADVQEPSYPSYTKNSTITWWTSTTNTQQAIQAFNKVYPNIHVVAPQIGGASPRYSKLTTAFKAGAGAPDVVQIEYQYLPKFIDAGGLADISQYVNQYKSEFPSWTWQQVSRSGKVYAVPEDISPMALLYRSSVFQKYHLTPPKTWQDFANDANKFHKEAPNQYYSFFILNEGAWITSLLWQAGVQPFKYTNNGWVIDLNDPKAKKVLNFWGDLIKNGSVKATSYYTPQWESEIGKGLYATVPGSTWGPEYMLQPYAKAETADWKAADMPQWNASGSFVDSNWGGSTNAVTTQSKNQQAAAIFATWINTSATGMELAIKGSDQGGRSLFPADVHASDVPGFNSPTPGLLNQVANPIFVKGAKAVDTSFQWSPWTDYVGNQMTVEFTKASQGQETWDQALDNIQNNTVSFAKSMGYQVVSADQASSASTSATGTKGSKVSPALIVVVVIVVAGVVVFFVRRRRAA